MARGGNASYPSGPCTLPPARSSGLGGQRRAFVRTEHLPGLQIANSAKKPRDWIFSPGQTAHAAYPGDPPIRDRGQTGTAGSSRPRLLLEPVRGPEDAIEH
jgi:hypothetical protein